jgi:SAM-dependent methyltransferase
MRKQQQIWWDEHVKPSMIPGLSQEEPSKVLEFAWHYFAQNGVGLPASAVDIGCGKGRNSIFLAKQGVRVTAFDYIEPALEVARGRAAAEAVEQMITFVNAVIDEPWPFENNSFDLALDSYSSIDIETRQGRETYRDELSRTLKPQGWLIVTVVAEDDELEKEMAEQTPAGAEPQSVIWPSGKFQKNYNEAELRDFYKDFEIIELIKRETPAHKLDRDYLAKNYWLLARKP